MGPIASKLKTLFSGNRHLELCLVGLENSGKTTILDILSTGHAADTMPTVGLNVRSVKKEGVTMKAWDLGGQQRFRGEWVRYAAECNVILFVVDSSDYERITIAKTELTKLLGSDDALEGLPLLVVLNKIDLTPHMSKEDVIRDMELEKITKNKWMVTQISARNKENIGELLDWLLKHSGTKK
eukprot:TRINITY_DN9385_c0_g4_i1.p1 TRINITY_DN9385_c0_g4~~TRINITY_DN9385_c0_g4_i1.p1  ORF type:complete len:183 (+),score=68.67 TRINITY_DN9385_c0_g4_i1:107-655(+)